MAHGSLESFVGVELRLSILRLDPILWPPLPRIWGEAGNEQKASKDKRQCSHDSLSLAFVCFVKYRFRHAHSQKVPSVQHESQRSEPHQRGHGGVPLWWPAKKVFSNWRMGLATSGLGRTYCPLLLAVGQNHPSYQSGRDCGTDRSCCERNRSPRFCLSRSPG